MHDEKAIQVLDLHKRFGDIHAVQGVSLDVQAGEILSLLGPNGAGKSTTIKMLMGMLSITSGRALALGIDVAVERERMKQRVGYVPENHCVYPWMRVGESIGFTRSFYETWNDELCIQLLKLFELDTRKKVKHLSKGMRVKLSLLLAICHEPEVLILDEPMAGLDAVVREEFLDGVLQTICDRQCTILFSSHTLDDVQRMADTIGILHEGRLLLHRPVDELLASTKRVRAVLSDGCAASRAPAGTIWQREQGREWLLTIDDYSPAVLEQIRAENELELVEVVDIGLEELFKDTIKGRRAAK